MSFLQYFISREEADAALAMKYTEDLLEKEGIEYAAVLKTKLKYYIEIGHLDVSKNKSLKNFSQIKINIDSIRESISVPIRFSKKNSFKKRLYGNQSHVKINVKTKVTSPINLIKNNFNDTEGGEHLRIYSRANQTGGTLGGLVRIKTETNKGSFCDLYAITNHHVIRKKHNLGIAVHKHYYNGGTYTSTAKIGHLFWSNFENVDVALARIKLDENQEQNREKIFKNVPWITEISKKIKINQKVFKIGLNPEIHGSKKGKIISHNAVVNVKVSDTKYKVFKHQILTEKISDKGDSGSLLFDNKKKPLGLLFATFTAEKKRGGKVIKQHITVANNLNDIFNNNLAQPQLAYDVSECDKPYSINSFNILKPQKP